MSFMSPEHNSIAQHEECMLVLLGDKHACAAKKITGSMATRSFTRTCANISKKEERNAKSVQSSYQAIASTSINERHEFHPLSRMRTKGGSLRSGSWPLFDFVSFSPGSPCLACSSPLVFDSSLESYFVVTSVEALSSGANLNTFLGLQRQPPETLVSNL